MPTCFACAEEISPGPRCRYCGERQDRTEDAPAPDLGYGGDSVAVATICVVISTVALVFGLRLLF